MKQINDSNGEQTQLKFYISFYFIDVALTLIFYAIEAIHFCP